MEKQSGKYWQERFRQMEKAQHDQSRQKALEIQKQFDRSLAVISGKIESWYQRYANNNGVSLVDARRMLQGRDLQELKWNVEDYIRYGKENARNGRWQKELENASARAHISRLEGLKLEVQQEMEKLYGNYNDTVDRHIRDVYINDYYHTAYEIQKGTGVGVQLSGLDTRQVEKVITKPWAVDGRNFSERIWTDKTRMIHELHNTLTTMCITGSAPQRAISQFTKAMQISRAQASRVILTESAVMATQASQDCMKDLGVEQYEVIGTLDGRTCEKCGRMDGKHFPMSEFQIGVTAPPFHPNCRCDTCPYFGDAFDSVGERAARGEDGKTYYVPADTTYQEWKKAFVDGDAEARDRLGLISNNNKNNPRYYDFKGKDLKTVEQELSQNDYETAVIFKNGKAISCQLGNEDTVKFTKHQLKLMKGNDITHNHPLSTPPSPEDLYLLVDHKAKSFRTCGKNGTYVLEYCKKVEKLPSFDVFEEKYSDILSELMPKYANKHGYIENQDSLISLGNEIWEELYKDYGVKPRFERR